ncbi:protein phosphatase 1 regulatory subunit 36-like isoform X2 [Ptychodera flava]|uniref:protein phosphatase 1 regulatory subunit 36-like isoform X2 n=1 Tax=Ptychodera flava TaxID=63121 RepID=UPI00396A63D1
MSAAAEIFEPLPQPTSGRWIWKEETNTLEFASSKNLMTTFASGVDSKDKRKRNKNITFGDGRKGDRSTPVTKYGMRNQAGGRMQQTRGYGGRSPRPTIKADADHTTVTLDDVKAVSLATLSEVHNPAEQFEDLISHAQFDDFLTALLNYFDGFFDKLAQERKPKTLTSEPSRAEKQYLHELSLKLEAAQKRLAQSYCVLVLGLGMDDFHHMGCGQQRVSSTYKDREMYETFYKYCVYVIWIVFRRKEFELVNKEIGRMLRSDVFNPALRVKHATEAAKKEDQLNNPDRKKLTPAQYRRQHPKRPAIKSIINQRSPVLVSVLPSPKQEADWLFRKPRPSSAGGLLEVPDDEDEDDDQMAASAVMKKLNTRIGIIGEPLSQYNPATLAPVGSEQDDENEENESRRGP